MTCQRRGRSTLVVLALALLTACSSTQSARLEEIVSLRAAEVSVVGSPSQTTVFADDADFDAALRKGVVEPRRAPSPDDALVVRTPYRAKASLWRVNPLPEVQLAELPEATASAFAADGRLLYLGTPEGEIVVYEVGPVDKVTSLGVALDAFPDAVGALVVSSDGRWLLAGSAHLVSLWHFDRGSFHAVGTWTGFAWGQRSLAIAPDGSWFMACLGDSLEPTVSRVRPRPDGTYGCDRRASFGSGAARDPRPYNPLFAAAADGFALVARFETVDVWHVRLQGDPSPTRVTSIGPPSPFGWFAGPVAFSADGEHVLANGREASAWRVFGLQPARIGGETIEWGLPRERPQGSPRVEAQASLSTTLDATELTITVTNVSSTPAYDVRARVHFVDAETPAGEIVRAAIGHVVPGGSVVRHVTLPRRLRRAHLTEIEVSGAWELVHSVRLEARPAPGVLTARTALRESLGIALDTLDVKAWERQDLVSRTFAALLRARDVPAAAQAGVALTRSRSGSSDRAARALARAGGGTRAFDLLPFEPGSHSWKCVRHEIAVASALGSGDPRGLREITTLIDDEGLVPEILQRIAAKGDRNQIRSALATLEGGVERCLTAHEQSLAYLEIVRAEVRLGFPAEARATVSRWSTGLARAWGTPYLRARALALLGIGFSVVGDTVASRDAFDRAAAPIEGRDDGWLARARHEAGDPRALEAARRKGGSAASREALAILSRVLPSSGLPPRVTSLRDEIELDYDRTDVVLRSTIPALAELGLVDAALALVPCLPYGARRATAVLDVARVVAATGARDRALAIARTIRLAAATPVLRGLSRELSVGDPETWGTIYDESFTGMGFMEALSASRALAEAALRLHLALGLEDAERYARSFAGVRGETIAVLARRHALEGDPAAAHAWVSSLDDPERRAWGLLGLGEGLLDRAER